MKKRTKENIAFLIAVFFVCGFLMWGNLLKVNANKIIYGDITGDGVVNLDDATAVLKFCLGIGKSEEEWKIICDINQDGDVTLDDANLVLKRALGIEIELPQNSEKPEPVKPDSSEVPTRMPKETFAPIEGNVESVVTGEAIVEDTVQEYGLEVVNPYIGKTALVESVEAVISKEAEEGKVNVWSLSGAGLEPAMSGCSGEVFDERVTERYTPDEVTYTIPQWNTGVSISLWAKVEAADSQAPLLVLNNSNDIESGTLYLLANGSVRYCAKTGSSELLLTSSTIEPLGTYGEWNHYTIAIANDWITVYINGQENYYDNCKFERFMTFNYGFMTRYHSLDYRTQDEIDAMKGTSAYYYCNRIGTTVSVFRNGAFWGSGTEFTVERTLMEFITSENTQMWIGNLQNPYAYAQQLNYQCSSDIEVRDVTGYLQELTAEQVASNYEYDIRNTGSK